MQDIVVLHEQQGQFPDEIVSAYPQLSLAKVYAALAYYHDHRVDIRQDMAEDEAFVADGLRRRGIDTSTTVGEVT